MAEIDDSRLATLEKGYKLLDELLKSPKTKRQVERHIKELHPDTIISDDYDNPVLTKIEELRKEFEEDRKVRKANAEDEAMAATFNALRTDGGYTDDGIDKIKKIMVDRKVADPFAAAAYYDKLNPPPEPQRPTSFAGTSWGFGHPSDDPNTKLLFQNEDAWAEQEAMKHFREQGSK